MFILFLFFFWAIYYTITLFQLSNMTYDEYQRIELIGEGYPYQIPTRYIRK